MSSATSGRADYEAHPLTRWCQWSESEEHCYSLATSGGLCTSHLGPLAKREQGVASAS